MVLRLDVAKRHHVQHGLEGVHIRVTHHVAQVNLMQRAPVDEGSGCHKAEGRRRAAEG